MKKQPSITIGKGFIGLDYPPLVVAEIGINHNGSLEKARELVKAAHDAGAEIVKLQTHIVEDEMVESEAKKVIPANSKVSIWEVMQKCALTEDEERNVKEYAEKLGMIYFSAPFSRAAAERLHRLGVQLFKIGSGECNNYPLIEHIAKWRVPMIISTGMNTIPEIRETVKIVKKYQTPYALMHCTNMYPTPYHLVRLGAIDEMRRAFPDAVLGLSDHSLGIWTCLGAVAHGASILEKHFTADKTWEGNDIEVSVDPREFKDLMDGSRAIWEARRGYKGPTKGEQPTIDFAFACVVTIAPIKKGEKLTMENIWVKRPGTGEFFARDFKKLLGRRAARDIARDMQVKRADIAR